MRAPQEEINALVQQTEKILDSVLCEQLRKVQQKQETILKEILEVEFLRDHIPLLRLQQQHMLKEQQRLDAALQRMQIRPPTPQLLPQQQQQQRKQQQQQPVEPFPLKCLADVGSHCYLPAVMNDASRLLVSVGFNFYVEMDLNTAEAFLKKKKEVLKGKYELWSRKSAQLKTQIRVLTETIAAVTEQPMLEELL